MAHEKFASDTTWEEEFGYSRAVKAGNIIEVAGTTASDGERIVGIGDYYLQTKFILEKISQYLTKAGGSLTDVTRTRIFVCDISHWEAVGKAHVHFFGNVKPASTMVEVSKLIHPDLLVEIEVTAVIDSK